MTLSTLVFGLGASLCAHAQQVGTLKENHLLPMGIAKCTKSGGCTHEQASVTMDANWRWLHEKDGYENCYKDSSWTCGSGSECASKCAIEGVTQTDWEKTYGISRTTGGVRVKFKTGGNVGSRFYMLDASENYKQFQLLNREITFDVDMSTVPCGMNGAVYFSEMPSDGGVSLGNAGAKYGTGYCDAQCPSDVKFISGEANSEDWNPQTARGKHGSCCAEMDIWEANNAATAFTAHPCSVDALHRCEGAECKTICDMPGCDFNSYRMGDQKFYGPGTEFKVNTLKPFSIVTQFITTDGTDSGDLAEVRRFYVQDGKAIENTKATLPGLKNQSVLSDEMCALDKKVFGETNTLKKFGGVKQMGEAISRGMTLVLSLWDDGYSKMNWLDSRDPVGGDLQKPGVARGPCSPDVGDPSNVRSKYADSYVDYYNFKYGEIGSTVQGAPVHPTPARPVPGPAPQPLHPPEPLPPQPPSSPASGQCCYGGCNGQCKSPTDWCSQGKQRCERNCNGQWCAKSAVMTEIKRHRQLRGREHAMAQKLFRLVRGKSAMHKLSKTAVGKEEL